MLGTWYVEDGMGPVRGWQRPLERDEHPADGEFARQLRWDGEHRLACSRDHLESRRADLATALREAPRADDESDRFVVIIQGLRQPPSGRSSELGQVHAVVS